MKIAGLQRVSTIDYPGEICCVVFLWGCNFRCGFCHNPELVVRGCDSEFSQEEVLDFLSRRVGKLDGVVISGGEPLLSLDLDFVRRVKGLGFKVKVDTNGSCPDRLRELVEEGLVDYIAMDVKCCREDYAKIVGLAPKGVPHAQMASDKSDRLGNVDLGKIEESIRIVDEFGRRGVGSRMNTDECEVEDCRSEFRTTVVPGLHDLESVRKMGEWVSGLCGGKAGRIFLQGFKGGGEMIDSSFEGVADVREGEVLEMKKGIDGLFDEVGVRV